MNAGGCSLAIGKIEAREKNVGANEIDYRN
jgi:hypothetical protein